MTRFITTLGVFLVLAIPIAAQMPQEKVDLDGIYKIKDEGLNRSQVMDIISYLTDVYGSRLTGSPQIKAAADWTKKKLTEWELTNVNLETWGPFGRGWTNEKIMARAISPAGNFSVIVYPKAWTPGTNGLVEGDVITAVISNEQDFEKFRGQLRGKYVMTAALPQVAAQFQAPGHRYTDDELQKHRRGDPVNGQSGRSRHAGRSLRFLAYRNRGDGQCRRLSSHDGGNEDPQSNSTQNATHRSARAVDR